MSFGDKKFTINLLSIFLSFQWFLIMFFDLTQCCVDDRPGKWEFLISHSFSDLSTPLRYIGLTHIFATDWSRVFTLINHFITSWWCAGCIVYYSLVKDVYRNGQNTRFWHFWLRGRLLTRIILRKLTQTS